MFINEIFADDAITKLSLFKSKSKKKQPLAKQNKKGVAEGSLEEIDRRGFLKGLGAAAAAGAGGAIAAPFKHSQTVDPMTDKVQGGNSTVVSDDGSAKLYIQWNSGVWFDLNQGTVGFARAYYGSPSQEIRIKVGDNPVQNITGLISKNWKSIQLGTSENSTRPLASKLLNHSGELRLEVLLADGNKKVFKFTIEPDATSKSVKEQGVAEGDVIRTKFATKQAQKNKDQYQRQPDIEIPLYNRIRNQSVLPKYASLLKDKLEPFDHFEIQTKSPKVTQIIGVTTDTRKVVVSTMMAPPESVEKFVAAMNRGGFSDVPIQRVSIKGYNDTDTKLEARQGVAEGLDEIDL